MYLSGVKKLTSGLDGLLNTIPPVAVADAEEPFIPPVMINNAMAMKDYMSGNLDIMYYGPVDFGTPAQRLTVDIDTGSADLWIPGTAFLAWQLRRIDMVTPVDCPQCVNKQFEDTRSSTCKDSDESFSIVYVSHFFYPHSFPF